MRDVDILTTFFTSGSLWDVVGEIRTLIEILSNILETAANKTLRIENGIPRIHRSLIFRGVSDETLFCRERNIGRCSAITLWSQVSKKTSMRKIQTKNARSLAIISTRSFCHTPTQLY